jgi:hypothetical protein
VETLEEAAVFLYIGSMEASSSASETEPVWDLIDSEDAQTVDHLLVQNKHKRLLLLLLLLLLLFIHSFIL